MEKECDTVMLEDGIVYAISDEITENGNTYLYLVNIADEQDFCIRKLKEENAGKMIIGLDDADEYDRALIYYVKKNGDK